MTGQELTRAEYDELVWRNTTEAAWQAHVQALLHSCGWTAMHITQSTTGGSRGRLRGDAGTAGWVDTWAWLIDHRHSRAALLMTELKRCASPAAEAKQLRPRQREILAQLDDIAMLANTSSLHVLTGVLRPRDTDLLMAIATDPWSVDQSEVPRA